MKFFAKASEVTKIKTDFLVVWAKSAKAKPEELELSPEARLVDRALDGLLIRTALKEGYQPQKAKALMLHTHDKIPADKILLVGLGNPQELSMSDWQTITATAARKVKEARADNFSLTLPEEVLDKLGLSQAAQGAVEGIKLRTYVFIKHKNQIAKDKEKQLEEVYFLTTPGRLNSIAQGCKRGETVAQAVNFARDLVNEPPSVTTPSYLGEVAKSVVKGDKNSSCEVLGKNEMEKLGMGALLGIAQGSSESPKFIKLTYDGGGSKTICLVGKGITFDAGGLSLKTAEGMETMKIDMAGAASILGIFKALINFKPKIKVIGLIAACENMPSGSAIKPGDIVTALNGKTIEIKNTDAEGRVVLADALSYACAEVKTDCIIDLATLTAACMVALGEEIAGLFANQTKLAYDLAQSAQKTGEKVWEMPLSDDYRELLKSDVADIKNSAGKRYAGAITAALFLQEFVSGAAIWAHLDIAGPAWAEKDTPLLQAGATGFGVRMILDYLQSVSK